MYSLGLAKGVAVLFRPEEKLILRLDSLTLIEAVRLVRQLKGRVYQYYVHDMLREYEPEEVISHLRAAGAQIIVADVEGSPETTLTKVIHAGANFAVVGSRVLRASTRGQAVEEIIGEIIESLENGEG